MDYVILGLYLAGSGWFAAGTLFVVPPKVGNLLGSFSFAAGTVLAILQKAGLV